MADYQFLAEATVVLHAFYAGFIVVLVPFILIGARRGWSWVRNFWLRIVHVVMMTIVGVEAVIGMTCPLTDLERHFRSEAGQTQPTEHVDFLAQWAERLLYLDFAPWVFDSGHVFFTLLLWLLLLLAPPRWPWRAVATPFLQPPVA